MRIRLTTPDGRNFEIAPDQIIALRDAESGEMTPGVKTVIYYSSYIQGVKETIDQINTLEKSNAKKALHRSHKSAHSSSRSGRFVRTDE